MTYMAFLSPGLGPLPSGLVVATSAPPELAINCKICSCTRPTGCRDFGHAGLRPVLPNRTGGRGAHRALDAARDPRAGARRQPPLQRHPARSPADVVLVAHQAPTPAR